MIGGDPEARDPPVVGGVDDDVDRVVVAGPPDVLSKAEDESGAADAPTDHRDAHISTVSIRPPSSCIAQIPLQRARRVATGAVGADGRLTGAESDEVHPRLAAHLGSVHGDAAELIDEIERLEVGDVGAEPRSPRITSSGVRDPSGSRTPSGSMPVNIGRRTSTPRSRAARV